MKRVGKAIFLHIWVVFLLVVGAVIFSELEKMDENLTASLDDIENVFKKELGQIRINGSTEEDVDFDFTLQCTAKKNLGDGDLKIECDVERPFSWEFCGALYFCLTAMSTIGFGNARPETRKGKIIVIFYVLISVPCFFCALAILSEGLFSILKKWVEWLLKKRCYGLLNQIRSSPDNEKIVFLIIIPLTLLSLIFILGIAYYSMVHNDAVDSWVNAIYFHVVTLTTVGFGDIVPEVHCLNVTVFVIYATFGLVIIGLFIEIAIELYDKAADHSITRTQSSFNNIRELGNTRQIIVSNDDFKQTEIHHIVELLTALPPIEIILISNDISIRSKLSTPEI